jgi:hypothetical protein
MRTFGSSTSDVVVNELTGTPVPNSPLTVWTAPGGTQFPAVLDLNGDPYPLAQPISESNGQFAFEIEDDDLDIVWVQDVNGQWYRVVAWETIDEAANAARDYPSIRALFDNAKKLWVSPFDYGGIGDGVADDTVAVQAALSSGKPIDWGSSAVVWRVRAALTYTLPKNTSWKANGATLRLDSVAAVAAFLAITHAQYSLSLIGDLIIDANQKAYSGATFTNATSAYVTLFLNRVQVINVRRGGTAFTGGDGIMIKGAFDLIELIRPVVRGVTMPTAAHTVGVQGVTGITIVSASLIQYWRKVEIIGPLVENVYTDELTDYGDQDGIRIMTAEDDITSTTVPYDSNFVISGYTAHNCMGRALKSQAEYGDVTDTMIIRDRNRGLTAGQGVDIDFQVGGGQVRGVATKYVNDAPNIVINFSGPVSGPNASPATAAKSVPHPLASDVRVVTSGGTHVGYLFNKSMRAEDSSVTHIRNVEAVGVQPGGFMNLVGLASPAVGFHELYVDEVLCGPSLADGQQGFFRVSPDGLTGLISLRRVRNTGSAMNLIGSPNTGGASLLEVSTDECRGFNDQAAYDAGRNVGGGFKRLNGIAAPGQPRAGIWRPIGQTIAASATWKLPQTGLGPAGIMALVMDDGSFGIFSWTATGVSAGGLNTGFTVGGTTDPAPASGYGLWSSATGPSISNRSGATRTLTGWMMG